MPNAQNTNTFETMNRKLEQFLFMHGINHIGQYKSVDGLNVWIYEKTPRFDSVVAEYRSIWVDKRRA